MYRNRAARQNTPKWAVIVGIAVLVIVVHVTLGHLAAAEWESQRKMLAAVQAGERFDGSEYEAAVRFFEVMSDIPSRGSDWSFIGQIPTREMGQDLSAWDEWRKDNSGLPRWRYVRWVVGA